MLLSSILVILIIGVELYKPIIIGNAIDDYINGYGGVEMEEAYQGILRAGVLYAACRFCTECFEYMESAKRGTVYYL